MSFRSVDSGLSGRKSNTAERTIKYSVFDNVLPRLSFLCYIVIAFLLATLSRNIKAAYITEPHLKKKTKDARYRLLAHVLSSLGYPQS